MKFIKSAVSIAALCLLSALTPLSVNAYEAVNAKIAVPYNNSHYIWNGV